MEREANFLKAVTAIVTIEDGSYATEEQGDFYGLQDTAAFIPLKTAAEGWSVLRKSRQLVINIVASLGMRQIRVQGAAKPKYGNMPQTGKGEDEF